MSALPSPPSLLPAAACCCLLLLYAPSSPSASAVAAACCFPLAPCCTTWPPVLSYVLWAALLPCRLLSCCTFPLAQLSPVPPRVILRFHRLRRWRC